MRTPGGAMMATPPAECSVSVPITVAAGKRVVQMALSAVVQCVSCNSTTFPTSNHLLLSCLLLVLTAEWGSTSHLAFQDTKPGPSATRLTCSARMMSSGVWSPMSCAQVVPTGVGDLCRSVHRALSDRMRPLHWRDLVHS